MTTKEWVDWGIEVLKDLGIPTLLGALLGGLFAYRGALQAAELGANKTHEHEKELIAFRALQEARARQYNAFTTIMGAWKEADIAFQNRTTLHRSPEQERAGIETYQRKAMLNLITAITRYGPNVGDEACSVLLYEFASAIQDALDGNAQTDDYPDTPFDQSELWYAMKNRETKAREALAKAFQNPEIRPLTAVP